MEEKNRVADEELLENVQGGVNLNGADKGAADKLAGLLRPVGQVINGETFLPDLFRRAKDLKLCVTDLFDIHIYILYITFIIFISFESRYAILSLNRVFCKGSFRMVKMLPENTLR